MSQSDALIAVGQIAAAFPHATIPPKTLELYAEKLADIQAPLLAATTDHLIEACKFFPTIAEIRYCAASLAGLLPLSPAEAIAIVRAADVRRPVYRRDGSLAYVEREWRWPDDLDARDLDTIRDALAKVGEPAGGDDESYFGWETGFQKTFAIHAEAAQRLAISNLSHAQLASGVKPKLLPAKSEP